MFVSTVGGVLVALGLTVAVVGCGAILVLIGREWSGKRHRAYWLWYWFMVGGCVVFAVGLSVERSERNGDPRAVCIEQRRAVGGEWVCERGALP